MEIDQKKDHTHTNKSLRIYLFQYNNFGGEHEYYKFLNLTKSTTSALSILIEMEYRWFFLIKVNYSYSHTDS